MMGRGITERLVELLKSKNMSQKELSLKAGVTESAISHYVNGDRVPRGANLSKIANALETTTDYLLDGKAANKKDDLMTARLLIARNANDMTRDERMELMKILLQGDTD
ncbi:helix-turn-helix domain-containing protein [Butyrivibrio fibrisolvens]|uniref:helix-turn-helix domain-containing protein n=1 Tax=Butyrivibrio fibrisolvens TaxID=831 RepID=UPI0004174398|nr:helix-turn-helix transcriptional regulator [Butyrivibrio fibrisolvens]